MKPRTLFGVLAAFVVVVLVAFLSSLNRELLIEPFRVSGGRSVPLFVVLLAVFLCGFLPVTVRLMLDSVRRDLEERQARRQLRQGESLEHSLHRAVDLLADGQPARAVKELEVVLQERPEHFEALLLLGVIQRRSGDSQAAVAAHQRAAAAHPRSVAVLYELVQDYEALGKPDIAEEIRNRIGRDFPGRGLAVLRHRRNLAVDQGDWPAATRLQEELDARRQELGEAATAGAAEVRKGLAYRRGVTLLEEERVADASEVFQTLLHDEPGFVPARIMLGEACLLAGNEAEAVAAWREGFERTHSPVFVQRLEDHFIEQGSPEQAIESLRSLAGDSDRDLLPRFFLGRLYYRLEMLDEAFKVLAPLDDRLEHSPTYNFLMARLHERRGELALAVERYRRCARLMGVQRTEFHCVRCRERCEEWQDRCTACGAWGSIELAIDAERVLEEELGPIPLPVWSGDES